MNKITAKSPLSSAQPTKVCDLPKETIFRFLKAYYGTQPPAEIIETDYTLWRCSETGIEFAWPMTPGNHAFYEWISSFDSYYTKYRWEYGKVNSLILENGPLDPNFSILDVGCGTGDFLRGVNFLPNTSKFGLDLTVSSVEACLKSGLQAFCGTIEEGMESGYLKKGMFDVVTSFHCLEHVCDPVAFVRSLMDVTQKGGQIYLSTPYSPMSFEDGWFDVLNHPPHHLTRWNLKSYQQLAKLLDIKMRYFSPDPSPLKRALSIFRLHRYGPSARVGKFHLFRDVLLNPISFIKQWNAQKIRGKSHPIGGNDLILVEITN